MDFAIVIVEQAEWNKVAAPDAQLKRLATGLRFTEGPVWLPNGKLVFSDIPSSRLMQWSPRDGLSVYRENSHEPNGNTLDREGRLVTAEHGSRSVTRTEPDGQILSLVSTFNGRKLNSPNDVIVKSDGTIWFSDPPYGIGNRLKEQQGNFVFCYNPETHQIRIAAQGFDCPNGLCFSPDESRLYIADSGQPRQIVSFNVLPDNTLEGAKVFYKMEAGVPDGIRCDAQGRLFTSAIDGVHVLLPDGKLIAKILTPEEQEGDDPNNRQRPTATNLCFGGPTGNTLFVTAGNGLYGIELLTTGATRPASPATQPATQPVSSDSKNP